MQKKVCAYCGSKGTLTREHIYPKSLYERTSGEMTQYLVAQDKFVDGEVTIRDVCANCNNGPLSQLDLYFAELYDSQLNTIVLWNQSVTFRYDFDKLARWLLKISYNVVRSQNKEHQIESLRSCSQYILNNVHRPNRLALFVQLIVPTLLPRATGKPIHELVAYEDYVPPEGERLVEIQPIIKDFHLV